MDNFRVFSKWEPLADGEGYSEGEIIAFNDIMALMCV